MSAILILTSINGRKLTNKLIDSWLNENEIFIMNKTFFDDQYAVEITFIDEERMEMMSDLLRTCYSDYVSISRPQTLMSSLNNSFEEEEEERELSPVHLSSAMSTSSRISCFSQRLVELDKNKSDNKITITMGRGRGIDTSLSRPSIKEKDDNQENNTISSTFGRGRGFVFK